MQHLAIIPDGNRRWAAKNKLAAFLGHKSGMDAIKNAISVCINRGIKHLSFYTFSLENFRRSEHEKNYLFSLLSDAFSKQLPELMAQGIRVRFIGDQSLYPEQIRAVIKNVQEKTAHLNVLNLNLLFCYGAKGEMVQAVKALAAQVQAGMIDPEAITEDTISSNLWTSGIPDPDLIIRTGGAIRLSNFLLYQAAYSELMFLDCYWPEVTTERIEGCIEEFNTIKRNFGS